MKWQSETIIKNFTSISSRLFVSCIVFFCLSGSVGALLIFFEIKWKFIEMIGILLLTVSGLLLFFSWITPGLLIMLGAPWLAHAWLRGINPIAVPSKPWEQLSSRVKVSIYLWAIGISSFALFAAVGLVLYNIQK